MLIAGSSLYNWMKLLIQNRFRIHVRYIPRAILITIVIILLTPLRWYEKLWNNKIRKVEIVQDPIFILGYWRSGTTFLHELFIRDPNLNHLTYYESIFPYIFLKFEPLMRWLLSFGPKTRPQDNMKLHPNFSGEHDFAIANLTLLSPYTGVYFPQNQKRYDKYATLEGLSSKELEQLKNVYQFIVQKVSFKKGMKQLVLKSPLDLGRIKLLLDVFPDSKFIEIYRDPYKIFFSTKKMFRKLSPRLQLQKRHGNLDDFVFNSFDKLYEIHDRDVGLIPQKNYASVKYEHLIANPLEEMKRIYSELSLPDFQAAKKKMEDYLSSVMDYQVNQYSIDQRDKWRIYHKWGRKINQWHYEKPLFPVIE